MQKINIGAACLLAFGGFLETNALKSKAAIAQDSEYLEPEPLDFAQSWFDDEYDSQDRPVPMVAAQTGTFKSTAWSELLRVTFNNASEQPVELFWHDYSGNTRSYGSLAPGQTLAMNTYATHPWSATGDGDFMVDGDDVFVPGTADQDRRISIVRKDPEFNCERSVNWMKHGPSYNQISLTDGCRNGKCDANPKYASDKTTCNNEEAIAFCQKECTEREENGTGCEGFFFQKHNNGHEICGFYASGMERGQQVWGGHQAGAICERASFSYDLVESGDCIGDQLVQSADECQEAIADVFGVLGARVETWNTSAYAKGCFKHNYGHPGSAQAAAAPTRWIFNLNGGPGTSGHCTGEPGYAACVCRDN
jgi:hypothetical protein